MNWKTESLGSRIVTLLLTAVTLSACDAVPERHLILITVDTLRADRLGAYGNDLELTPHLDALASESALFLHAFSPAPFTLPSISSLMTGRYPDQVGIRKNQDALSESIPTLATRLRQTGFRTGAVVSNFVLRRKTGLGHGFGIYNDRFTRRKLSRGLPERNAPATTAAALVVLDALRSRDDEPFFFWVHYQDPHGPYTAPPSFLGPPGLPPPGTEDRDLELEREDIGVEGLPHYQRSGQNRATRFYRAAYHGEIRFMDAAVGEFLAGLRERELYDRAIVVFTADHGESLGENARWFCHGEFVTASETHVPLMIRVPGRAPEVRRDVTSLLDISTTVLAAIDPALPPLGAGRDLLREGASAEQSEIFLSTLGMPSPGRRGLVSDGFRLVVAQDSDRSQADLDTGLYRIEDEAFGLRAADPVRIKAMSDHLRQLRGDLERPDEGITQRLSEQEREQLRALGYSADP